MNEEKIKKLEAEIEALKKEKPRTDREILESIEELLKKMLDNYSQSEITSDEINEIINKFARSRSYPSLYTWDYTGKPDLEKDPDFYNRQKRFREFLTNNKGKL